jgi:IS5 family transposase
MGEFDLDGAIVEQFGGAVNTASDVWADTAYRSGQERGTFGEERLAKPNPSQKAEGQVHAGGRRKKAKGKKSKVRAGACVARQKGPIGLFISFIGLARAKVKIGLANLTHGQRAAG